MNNVSSVIRTVGLIALLLLVLAPAAWSLQLTTNAGDDTNSDIAVDSATNDIHVVYERAGDVYYISRSGGSWGTEELISAGSTPAVALDSNGIPHVLYASAGTVWYTMRSGGGWQEPAVVAPGSSPDLGIGPDDVVQVVFKSPDVDYNDRGNIVYGNNASGAFGNFLTLCDGWFWSPTGHYCYSPVIAIDANGLYHITWHDQNVDTTPRWGHDPHYTYYSTNAGGGIARTSHDLNPSASNTGSPQSLRNSLAIDSLGNAHIVYSNSMEGNVIYYTPDGFGAAGETAIASGSSPVITIDGSDTVHIVYRDQNGGVSYILNSGSGFSLPLQLAAAGNLPAAASGATSSHLTYEASDGADSEMHYLKLGPSVSAAPSIHDFGDNLMGISSDPLEITISNTGISTLSVSNISLADVLNFSLDVNGGGSPCSSAAPSIAPGASCTVTVTFNPTVADTFKTTLSVDSDDPETPTLSLGLDGRGVYSIEASVSGGNGTISCAPAFVTSGSSSECTITPDANYHLSSLTDNSVDVTGLATPVGAKLPSVIATNGMPAGNALSYTIADVADAHTVIAAFAIDSFTVTPSAGPNGVLDPDSDQTVTSGSTVTFTATANEGYYVKSVSGCGGTPYSNTSPAVSSYSYETPGITSSCTVTAQFRQIPPAAPTALTASVVYPGKVRLSWTDSAQTESGYRVERKEAGGSYSQISVLGTGVTTYQNTNLTPGTTYSYRVRAYNAGGNSAYSNETEVAIPALPADPTGLTVNMVTETNARLSWADNAANEAGYKIERKEAGGSYSQIVGLAAGAKGYRNNGLVTGKTYTYRVRAYNAAGDSQYSNEASVTTGVPNAPSNVSARAISPSDVFVAWKDNSSIESGFVVERKTGDCSSLQPWAEATRTGPDVVVATDMGLNPNTIYSYRVKAFSESSESSYTGCFASIRTGVSGSPASPTDLTAMSDGSPQVSLTWVDNSDNETSFKIYRKSGSDAAQYLGTVGQGETAFTDTAAIGNGSTMLYSYAVRSCNGYGCSPSSAWAVVPLSPFNSQATPASSDSIVVTWQDASSGDTGFEIYRKDGDCVAANPWNYAGATSRGITTFTESGLPSGTTFAYGVRARMDSLLQPFAFGYSQMDTCTSSTTP